MNDIERAVEEFFAASEAGDFEQGRTVVRDDAVLWQNTVGIERTYAESIPHLTKLHRDAGPWAYENVRRVIGSNSLSEQHTVTFSRPGHPAVSFEVCVVVRFDDEGRISRMDEYLDSAATEALRGLRTIAEGAPR